MNKYLEHLAEQPTAEFLEDKEPLSIEEAYALWKLGVPNVHYRDRDFSVEVSKWDSDVHWMLEEPISEYEFFFIYK